MNTLTGLWPLWVYLAVWVASLRPMFRAVLSSSDQHHIKMGEAPDAEDRAIAFVMAATAGMFWPLVLPFYGLYRLINPTVKTRADEHAELLALRKLARKHNLPMPETTQEGKQP